MKFILYFALSCIPAFLIYLCSIEVRSLNYIHYSRRYKIMLLACFVFFSTMMILDVYGFFSKKTLIGFQGYFVLIMFIGLVLTGIINAFLFFVKFKSDSIEYRTGYKTKSLLYSDIIDVRLTYWGLNIISERSTIRIPSFAIGFDSSIKKFKEEGILNDNKAN